MKIFLRHISFNFIIATLVCCSLTSCLTPKKLDIFVAEQYNNELPKPNKKKKADLEVTLPTTIANATISTTVHKTDKFLPLLVYWKYDHRHRCDLNPNIATVNFSNAVNTLSTKALSDKLMGKKLELLVEKAPATFSIVLKENLVWLIYGFSWSKIYIEPKLDDLVVSYKVKDANNTLKTGTITVKNNDKNRGIRFFQSWKSATSEYLGEYNTNFTTMTKAFVTQLSQEL